MLQQGPVLSLRMEYTYSFTTGFLIVCLLTSVQLICFHACAEGRSSADVGAMRTVHRQCKHATALV
jgi:hypothetical protein